ncbi:MAG: multidrug family transporter permease [Anaerocolumna sp.]|nr:multidrug family transporter permease [Anaerocolumna sp.]
MLIIIKMKYIEIAKISYKAQLAWRFDIIFNVLFTVIKIIFAVILWGAVFGERDVVSGLTFHTMLSYYIISSFLSKIELSDGVSGEISHRIREGSFSKYMVLPAKVEGYFLAQTLGAASFYAILNFIAAAIWIFIFRIQFTFTSDFKLIISGIILTILGLIFMVQLNFLLGILTLKFQDIQLFLMIKNTLVAFITGTMLPLSLLPEIVIGIMRFFPFYYITYLPSMLFIGNNQEEAIRGVAILSAWVLVFIIINNFSYNKLRIKFDGVGI